jgi:hypothetical protein
MPWLTSALRPKTPPGYAAAAIHAFRSLPSHQNSTLLRCSCGDSCVLHTIILVNIYCEEAVHLREQKRCLQCNCCFHYGLFHHCRFGRNGKVRTSPVFGPGVTVDFDFDVTPTFHLNTRHATREASSESRTSGRGTGTEISCLASIAIYGTINIYANGERHFGGTIGSCGYRKGATDTHTYYPPSPTTGPTRTRGRIQKATPYL